jgi:hypothetical protein
MGLRTRPIASVGPAEGVLEEHVAKDLSDISFTSAPAAKAFSEPVTTIARTRTAASNSVSASASSSSSCAFSAFIASGRLSRIMPTWSSVSAIRVS